MEKKENSIQISHFDTWWLEITTAVPSNIHNFGPFFSETEARVSQYERVQDLITKKSRGITVKIKNSPPE